MTDAADKTCPGCGQVDNYWLHETEKECKACGTTWFSAWGLALNDTREEESA